MQNILVIGALSDIARNIVHEYFLRNKDSRFILCARDLSGLEALRNELDGSQSQRFELIKIDVCDSSEREKLYERTLGGKHDIDLVILAWGVLSLSETSDYKYRDLALADFYAVNFVSFIQLADFYASYLAERKKGTIVVFGSVAGDRGRASNYLYGSAKAGLAAFCEGLEQKMYPFGVRIICVKPGFVDTAMTANLSKNFLYAKPRAVAKSIVSFVESGGSGFYYVPWFWAWILWGVRCVPHLIFKRLG